MIGLAPTCNGWLCTVFWVLLGFCDLIGNYSPWAGIILIFGCAMYAIWLAREIKNWIAEKKQT